MFTIHVPSLLTCVFTGCLSSNIAGYVHLQNSLATLQLFSEDCYFTVDSRLGISTPNSQLTALPLGWITDWMLQLLCNSFIEQGNMAALLLRHSRNTSRDVYRTRVRHIVCVILVTRRVMFTVPPYCLRRHTLLLHGCLATVVNKRHIAYSMHVTISYHLHLSRETCRPICLHAAHIVIHIYYCLLYECTYYMFTTTHVQSVLSAFKIWRSDDGELKSPKHY
jgi:hypothetical protein